MMGESSTIYQTTEALTEGKAMGDDKSRNWFGGGAFLVSALVIAYALSPLVPANKENMAFMIVGNAMGWPLMVLAYYFGSSSGSKQKSKALTDKLDLLDPPTGIGGGVQ